MKKIRSAAALLLAALLAPVALGGVMEADVASPQPPPPAATEPAGESASPAVTLVEAALDVVRIVLPLF